MHAASNQVEIPLDRLDEFLVARAVPDFTGTVRVSVRVLPTAAHEVEFTAETRAVHHVDTSRDRGTPLVTNARVTKVRNLIREHAHRFTIGTKMIAIEASFVAGEIRSFHIVEEEKCQAQASR